MRLRITLTLLALTLLSSCGYSLRGASNSLQALPFTTLTVTGTISSVLQQALTDYLLNLNVRIQPTGAQAVLHIRQAQISKQVLSLNRSGHVSEYTLRASIVFELYDDDDCLLLPVTPLEITRHLELNEEGNHLSDLAYEQEIRAQMHDALIQRLGQSLAYAKARCAN